MKSKGVIIVMVIWALTLIIILQFCTSYIKLKEKCVINNNVYHPNYENLNILTKIPKSENILQNLQELKNFFFVMNNQQPIFNSDLYQNISLVIVVQVHNRSQYLVHLITSLSLAPEINETLLVFSHDVFDPIINAMVKNITFTKVMQIFYPFSMQSYPEGFPGPESETRRNAEITQIKHHWWWKLNFVFNKIKVLKNYNNMVLFLEEDHYVASDFIYCLYLMKKKAKQFCPQCWFFSLSFWAYMNKNFTLNYDLAIVQKSVENFGLAFNRSVWQAISRHSDIFCKYDDYNWDWTLRHMIYDIFKPRPLSMIMVQPRVGHIGICGFHAKSQSCDAKEVIKSFTEKNQNQFPPDLQVLSAKYVYNMNKNGGWDDQRDHALCLGMT